MAVTALSSTTDTSAAALATNVAADATSTSTSDRFLKLLVAQMQNQDPLNPMDNAQVTSQIAQINTVSGIEKLNNQVGDLNGQFVQMQALQGAALVGHDVVVPGDRLSISDKVGQGGYELAADATAVKLEVLSPSGQVVATQQLGAQKAGLQTFEWPAGSATNDSALTFRVTATSGGTEAAAPTLMRDRVAAVSTAGGSFSLELANAGTVPYASVRAFD